MASTKKTTHKKTNKFILVDGTSSSGKSFICNYFSTKNFGCIGIDDYFNDKRINYDNLFKKIKNNYGAADKLYETDVEYMINDAISLNKNVILDHISQTHIISYMKKKKIYSQLYIINLYTNLDDLAHNLESRRKKGDRRQIKTTYQQFADRYIKCSNNNIKKIEIINRKKFKNLLLKYFKYTFEDKDELINFSNELFKKMNINDDDDHYIKVRDEIKYDYLLISTNKSKDEKFNELSKLFINLKIYN
jgi:hypothetical protein